MDIEVYNQSFPADQILGCHNPDQFLVLCSGDFLDGAVKIGLADADQIGIFIGYIHLLLQHVVNIVQHAFQHMGCLIPCHVFVHRNTGKHLACLHDHLSFAEGINIFQKGFLFLVQGMNVAAEIFLCFLQIPDFRSRPFYTGLCFIIGILHRRKFLFHINALAFHPVQLLRRFFRFLCHIFIFFISCFQLELSLFQFPVLHLDFLVQVIHPGLQFGQAKKSHPHVFIHHGHDSHGGKGNEYARNNGNNHRCIFRPESEKSHPFFAYFGADTVSQKGNHPAHDNEDKKYGGPYKHETPPSLSYDLKLIS